MTLISYSAHAQVISGTIVILNLTKDKTIVAADSSSESTKLAVTIVEMTIDAYEKPCDVGGAVDTITITKGGQHYLEFPQKQLFRRSGLTFPRLADRRPLSQDQPTFRESRASPCWLFMR
jgi:hypothetical protein